jgi:hypothetical protein
MAVGVDSLFLALRRMQQVGNGWIVAQVHQLQALRVQQYAQLFRQLRPENP